MRHSIKSHAWRWQQQPTQRLAPICVSFWSRRVPENKRKSLIMCECMCDRGHRWVATKKKSLKQIAITTLLNASRTCARERETTKSPPRCGVWISEIFEEHETSCVINRTAAAIAKRSLSQTANAIDHVKDVISKSLLKKLTTNAVRFGRCVLEVRINWWARERDRFALLIMQIAINHASP